MEIKFDHIGWTTNNPQLFEKFWCDVLGFVLEKESVLTNEMASSLFGLSSSAAIKRYRKESMIVEIHIFENPAVASQTFDRFGISHMCLHVDDRAGFLNSLPSWVEQKIYRNPGGWENVFIRDLEGNYIEVRTTL